MNQLSISLGKISKDFSAHLEYNKRILFSGAYGIGKTYFLKEYFKDREEYNVFHLFPVNYQVSQNEDMFELVKHDILNHIVNFGWLDETSSEIISKHFAFQFYLTQKLPELFLKILPKKVKDPVEKGKDIYSDFLEFYKKIKENDIDVIQEYIENDFINRKGSIYELDPITQLIDQLLEENKGEGKKENILIIDDLDRIDPEHIFRILNVFSAHFDIDNENSNKFGFDKIIFVCDINNIRNIFSTKYGVNCDFNGYINKFFSTYIYNFVNEDEMVKSVKSYIEYQMQGMPPDTPQQAVSLLIKNILTLFILNGLINIRHLKNLEKINFDYSYTGNRMFSRPYPLITSMQMLLFLLNNDKIKLFEIFNKITFIKKNDLIESLCRYILPLLDKKLNQYKKVGDTKYISEEAGIKFEYYMDEEFRYDIYKALKIKSSSIDTQEDVSLQDNHIQILFKEVLEFLEEENLLLPWQVEN